MMKTNYLLLICFFISLLAKSVHLHNFFGIDPYRLNDYYVKVLFDNSLSSADQLALSNRMSASFLYTNIALNFDAIEKANKSQKDLIFSTKHIKNIFENDLTKIAENDEVQSLSLATICNLWRFEKVTYEIRSEIEAKRTRLMSKTVLIEKMKIYNCAEIGKLVEKSQQNGDRQALPKWVTEFRSQLSIMHFVALNTFIKVDEHKIKVSDWFENGQAEKESILSFLFRQMNLEGKMQLIKEAKRRITRNLMTVEEMHLLEQGNPIRLAAGFQDESTTRQYFMMIFCKDDHNIEEFLEYAIICSQIFDIFIGQNAKKRQEMEPLWKRFNKTIEGIEIVHHQDGRLTLTKSDNLLDALRDMHLWAKKYDAVDRTAKGQRPKALLNELAQNLINLYKESEQFRQCFGQQIIVRKRFKKMIKRFIEENDYDEHAILPDHFRNIIDDETMLLKTQSQSNAESFAKTMIIKDACPDKNIPLEDLKESDRRNNELVDTQKLVELYIQLLWEINEVEEHSASAAPKANHLDKNNENLLRNVEIEVILFYYQNRVEELLKNAKYYLENKEFAERINSYFEQFLKLIKEQNQSDKKSKQKMCKIYQYIYKICKDIELMEMDDEWKELLTKIVKEFGSIKDDQISIGQIVLLPEQQTQWHQINCANEHNVDNLVAEFRKNKKLLELLHLFSLINLISTFDQIRSIFCHGRPSNIYRLKQRIVSLISFRTLDKLEMFFPNAMHYDQVIPAQKVQMLLNQFIHKSESLQAQNAMARVSSPDLINALKQVEIKMLKNEYKIFKNVPKIREIILGKITFIRNEFFARLAVASQENLFVRQALCPLVYLFELLGGILQGNTGIEDAINFKKWYPRECDSENGIKRALNKNRIIFKEQINDYFEQHVATLPRLLNAIGGKFGTKTRLMKLVSPEAWDEPLPDIRNSSWHIRTMWTNQTADELFNDEDQLIAHYTEFLTETDSMRWLNCKLKCDLFIFVSWIDAKISNFTNINLTFAQRFAIIWNRNKFIFYQLYDRWFDEEMHKMGQIHIYQSVFLSEINLFVEKNLHGKQMKSEKMLEDELRKIIKKTQEMYEMKNKFNILNVYKKEEYIKFDDKIMEMHVERINKFVGQNAVFKEALKLIYESAIDIEKLPEYLGQGVIIQIWKKINLKYFEENGKIEKEDEEEEEKQEEPQEEEEEKQKIKTKPLKKKLKRKKNKNGNEKNVTKIIGTVKDKNDYSSMIDGAKGTVIGNNATENGGNSTETAECLLSAPAATVSSDTVENGNGQTAITVAANSTANDESDLAENERPKFNNFVDDHFLASKYAEFVDFFIINQQNDDTQRTSASIKFLNVGIFANEIFHRLEAIEWLSSDQRLNMNTNKISDQWKWLKELKHSDKYSQKELLHKLCQLLKDLLEEMSEFEANLDDKNKFEWNCRNKTDKNSCPNTELDDENLNEINKQLHIRKFGNAIVEGRIKNWEKMNNNTQKKMMALLLNIDCIGEKQKCDKILKEFQRNLKLLKVAETQRKLDKKVLSQYKSEENFIVFIGKTDKINFCDENSQIFPFEKWQELYSSTERERKLLESEKLKNALELINGKQIGKETFIKMITIFEEWSDAAQFQFPIAYFLLKDVRHKFDTICLLPDGFDKESIFGNLSTECDLMNREICSDNSLYCALCKKLNLKFIKKWSKNRFINIPMLEIGLENVQVNVKFVQIPEFAHIPRKNFNAKQLEIFSIKYGQNIDKLEENDHFDEGVYWHEIKTRNALRKSKYENNTKMASGDELTKITNEMEQFDKITELFHQSRAKALKQRELVKERKEALYVLADFTMNVKLLQFLLLENNYVSIVNKFELDDDFGIRTLEKFGTIFAYLERWAKNNHIFDKSLGYLNDQMLLLMLTKVFVLFPDSSLPFLIDKFFLIYSKWKWPMSVRLSEIGNKRFRQLFGWSPFREWFARRQIVLESLPKNNGAEMENKKRLKKALKRIRMELAMAIIMPTFPERNVAEHVNISSAKVVRNELRRASEKIRNKKDLCAINAPIRATKFTEKYENFIVIVCSGPKFNVGRFSEFVGQRLRYELLEFVENPLKLWVDFCHLFPTIIVPMECQSDTEPKNENNNNLICEQFWLVGIQMAPNNQRPNSAFKSKLKDNLRKKMDVKIKEDFEKGCFHNVQLKSQFVERENLIKTFSLYRLGPLIHTFKRNEWPTSKVNDK